MSPLNGAGATWYHHVQGAQAGEIWLSMGKTKDGYVLHYPGMATFLLDPEGAVTDTRLVGDTPVATLHHLVWSQVAPMARSHRGELVLHASAAEVDGGAVAFIGESGWGKSTLTASLCRDGHALVSDDVLVVEGEGRARTVLPSVSEQRLWSDSAEALGLRSGDDLTAAHYTDKLRLDPVARGLRVADAPLPLRKVYFLSPPSESTNTVDVRIDPVAPRDRIARLLRQTFRLDLTDQARLRRELDQLTAFAMDVPIRRLTYPRAFDRLADVRRAILDDLATMEHPSDAAG